MYYQEKILTNQQILSLVTNNPQLSSKFLEYMKGIETNPLILADYSDRIDIIEKHKQNDPNIETEFKYYNFPKIIQFLNEEGILPVYMWILEGSTFINSANFIGTDIRRAFVENLNSVVFYDDNSSICTELGWCVECFYYDKQDELNTAYLQTTSMNINFSCPSLNFAYNTGSYDFPVIMRTYFQEEFNRLKNRFSK